MRKIEDTTYNYGKAEDNLLVSTDFKRFMVGNYGKADFLNIKPLEIVKKYNLKGLTFGNYVTQEERYHFLFKISKQLELLALIGKNKDLGKGVLIISFGVEGMPRANAHYNPSKNLININRGRKTDYRNVLKGENSFVHEYGHFIDFRQGRKDKKIYTNYACEKEQNAVMGNDKTKRFATAVNMVKDNEKYMAGLEDLRNSDYFKSRVELWARLFETTITYLVNKKYPLKSIYFAEKKYKAIIYLPKKDIFKNDFDKLIVKILQESK